MFTGIIEEVGRVRRVKHKKESSILEIEGEIIFSDMKLGDSISTNGVCLTVTSFSEKIFTSDVMHTTLKATTIGDIKIGDYVNLERAMPLNGRFGGHIVSGHIDGTAVIKSVESIGNAWMYTFLCENSLLKYMIQKGSITIDGISLTISSVTKDGFAVSIIPHTSKETTLSFKKAGGKVNIELDVLGKYVERLLFFDTEKSAEKISTLSEKFLERHGYK